MNNNYILTSNGELYHYGVKGMKWGVRRYQDDKGRLSAEGIQRKQDLISKYKKMNDTEENRITRDRSGTYVMKNQKSYDARYQAKNKMSSAKEKYIRSNSDYQKLISESSELQGKMWRENDSVKRGQMMKRDRELSNLINKKRIELTKEWDKSSQKREMSEKLIQKVNDAMMSDLGYSVDEGRRYLYDLGIDDLAKESGY